MYESDSVGGEPGRSHERRQPGLQARARILGRAGQEVAIAPQRQRARRDPLAADHGLDPLGVVQHLERTEAVLAHVRRGQLAHPLALLTSERGRRRRLVAHPASRSAN